jgi:hypothetical protein
MIGCVLRVAVLLLLRETSALHVEEILYTGDTLQNVSLGYSVSVDGDIAIVGAPEFDSRLGAAYIFSPIHKVDSPVRWSATARLTPATSMEGFGSQVSLRRLARTYAERGFISRYFQVRIHGSVCAVTCAMDFEIGKPSVHIYEAEGDVGWQWRARLTPSCDPACADDGVTGLPLCWPVAALESTLCRDPVGAPCRLCRCRTAHEHAGLELGAHFRAAQWAVVANLDHRSRISHRWEAHRSGPTAVPKEPSHTARGRVRLMAVADRHALVRSARRD